MKIAIGCDHGGFELKEKLAKYLKEKGHEITDCGTYSTEPADYPKFAYAAAKKVSEGQCDRGIIIDGAGIGSCITANKVTGARAAACYDVSLARNSREHNDANILTLGAGWAGFQLAKEIVDVWLGANCLEERHKKRVAMIMDIEKGVLPPLPAPPPCSCSGCSQNKQDVMADLSAEDLKKIADKLQTMIGGPCKIVDGNIVCTKGSTTLIHYGHPTSLDSGAVKKMIEAGASRIGYTPDGKDLPEEIAKTIDHTILKPNAVPEEIKKLCEEAKQYKFASVCVNPYYVKLCAQLLHGTQVKVCSVVGFPFGATPPEIKGMEARRAIRDGAKEIDMVINVGALKAKDDETVLKDIRAVTDACRDGGAISKVIIETAFLTNEEKVRACLLAKKAGANFVKTSTGYGPGGATVHDVALMKETVKGTKMGVKASGGIRSFADAKKMIEAGATRIGASASVKITQEAKGDKLNG
ncbi:MAG: deoxyribose-phosphate aldolase [Elusimicrobia bacterium]|nr:deoxyribose-phosphate aldolase [Elusimicrobiota bacterium]